MSTPERTWLSACSPGQLRRLANHAERMSQVEEIVSNTQPICETLISVTIRL